MAEEDGEDGEDGRTGACALMGSYALWIDSISRPGWRNMAIDVALLERAQAGERWLRLYGWDPPCLSFGRHEPARRRYDVERIAALGLAVVRRPTGGRAVWHARELTYAVAAPSAGLGSLREAYQEIHRMLCDALAALGVPAELAPVRPAAGVDAGACFAHPAGGEVMVCGRKVIGSAQLREATAFLQHGSILLEDDQSTVTEVTRGAAAADLSAPLARLLGRAVARGDMAAAVALAAEARWGAPAERIESTGHILERSDAHAPRFRSPAWTWSGATGA
jgi:lipoate-protein ligase A